MNITARLEALAAAPKFWLATATYDDGKVRTLNCLSEKAAQNHADMDRRRIGKLLTDRETGETRSIVSVTVEFVGA